MLLGLSRSISSSPAHDQREFQRAMMNFLKIDSVRGIIRSWKEQPEKKEIILSTPDYSDWTKQMIQAIMSFRCWDE